MAKLSRPDQGRVRHVKIRRNAKPARVEFINPYPWMSAIEAMVHLDLESRQVPFSWRYFDGDSVNIRTLLPDFTPEFTLREHKLVILIIGDFWGTLPAVLDMNALAQALLEMEGWTVATLYEHEIRRDVHTTITTKIPMLATPRIHGSPRPNPYGRPDLMSTRKNNLRGQALARAKFKTDPGARRVGSGIRRIRRRLGADGQRRRPGHS